MVLSAFQEGILAFCVSFPSDEFFSKKFANP